MLNYSSKSLKDLNNDYQVFNINMPGRQHYIQFTHGFIRGWNSITRVKLYHWVYAQLYIPDLVEYLAKEFEIVIDPLRITYYNVLILSQDQVELHYHMVIDYFNAHTLGKHIVY